MKYDIEKILPHREPMLLISEIVSLEPGVRATVLWHVDKDRDLFRGHFPGDPVLPGVYSVECMAQAADLLFLTLERYKGKTPLFLGINNVRFRKKVLPGDTLKVEVQCTDERKEKGIAVCYAKAFVNEEIAAEGEVTLAMR